MDIQAGIELLQKLTGGDSDEAFLLRDPCHACSCPICNCYVRLQRPFVNDAEEFVRNISVLLEEKSPHDYSVRRIEEILLNNGYLEEYFKGNTEPLALYCFEYIINHESLCYVSDNQNVSFSGNDKAIALIAWELMLTYDDTDLNYITSASSLENWLYFL